MKSCAICGSHAFNMATEGVNQGGFCDRHYWQRKAEALEAARATPALPQVSEYNHAKCPGHDAYAASQALPQGVEEFIRLHGYERVWNSYTEYCVSQEDLRNYLSGMAIVPVEPTKEMVLAAVCCMNDGDCMQGFDAENCESCLENTAEIYTYMLAAAKEPATCSVCGLKRSDTKNCKAPDCSPMLTAAKEKGE